MLTADEVLAVLLASPVVMGMLDSGPCVIEHVSVRDPAGPDKRTDPCPCDRGLPDGEPAVELGGGHYVSSLRHTLGDLLRDAAGVK